MRALRAGKTKEDIMRDAKLNLVDQALDGTTQDGDRNALLDRVEEGFSNISRWEFDHLVSGPGPTLVQDRTDDAEAL